MNRPFSLYLDFLRVLAAFVVLLSHWAYPRFTDGSYVVIRELNLGSDAVVLFFVLSGLVIAYAADQKDRVPGRFFFNRATRMYSVALPALLFAYMLDLSGAALNPQAYLGTWWYNPMDLATLLYHGLSFNNEWSLPGVRLGSNGPYWSLSYEAAYYLIFGAAVFMSGVWRILAIGALCYLVGLNVLLLAPIWFLGVLLWSLMKHDALVISRPTAFALVWTPIVFYCAALALDLPVRLLGLSAYIAGMELETFRAITRFSDEFVWNTLVGLLAFIHLIGMFVVLKARKNVLPAGSTWVRWLAGGSFSIYLVHYPVLQFFGSAVPLGPAGLLRDILLLAIVVTVCLFFARLFERPLPQLRSALKRFADRRSPELA